MTVPNPGSSEAGGSNGNLLEIRNLRKYFPIRGGIFSRVVANVKAVTAKEKNVKVRVKVISLFLIYL